MAQALLGLPVTSSVVSLTRARLQLSLHGLAEAVSERLKAAKLDPVSVEDIGAWESGRGRPSLAQAEALADALLIPFCALMADDIEKDPVLDFRRAPNTASRDPLSYQTRIKLAQFEAFYRLAKELVRATETIEDVGVPNAPRADLRDPEAVEHAGKLVREAIGLSSKRQVSWADDNFAFADLRSAVESSGVFVFAFSLNVDEVRGVSKWERGGPPAVLVNTADSRAASLFTLMHEYAHLVASNPNRAFVCDPATPGLGAEALANRIAGAALIPRSLLEALLVDTGPRHLPYNAWPKNLRSMLRNSLNVSHPVIGIRLSHLNLAAGPGVTKSFWRHGAGFGRGNATTAERYRRYLGKRTWDLAATAVDRDLLSPATISRLLDISTKHVEAALEL